MEYIQEVAELGDCRHGPWSDPETAQLQFHLVVNTARGACSSAGSMSLSHHAEISSVCLKSYSDRRDFLMARASSTLTMEESLTLLWRQFTRSAMTALINPHDQGWIRWK